MTQAHPAGRAHPDPETGQAPVPDGVFPIPGSQPGDGGVGEHPALPCRHGSAPLQRAAHRLGGLHHRHICGMRVFEGCLRIGVTEHPADGEHRLALAQGEAGMRVPEVVKPDVGDIRFRADHVPDTVEPRGAPRPPRARAREDPCARPVQRVQNPPRRGRQPHRAGTDLAVPQEQMPRPVVGPAERQNLALAAAGQQKEADDRDLMREPIRVLRQNRRQEAELPVGEKPLAALAAIAADTPARVGALGPKPHRLGFAHNDREHRHRTIRRDRRRTQRGEPVSDVPRVDLRDGCPRETGQDLVLEVAPVHLKSAWLPGPLVPGEHGSGDGLEERLLRPGRAHSRPA